MPPAAILIVAPPSLQRQGLLFTLRDARPDLLLAATADARTLTVRLARDQPALLILDAALSAPPLEQLIEHVQRVRPEQRLLVLGGRRLPFHVARLVVEMGGGLLLARRATPAEVLAAVLRLLGEDSLPLGAEEEPGGYNPLGLSAKPLPLLSAREHEILGLVASDYSNQEIADQLFISIRTVEAHRRMLLEKTGARSMIGLVLQAVRSGWLQVY